MVLGVSEAILSEQPRGEASKRAYSPRAPGPRGGYRRTKLRRGERRVVELLRTRSFASVYEISKELNSFTVFKTVRGLVRLGLIAKDGTRPVLTEKALHLGDAPFYVPANATQRFVPIETVAPAAIVPDLEPVPVAPRIPLRRHIGRRIRIGETLEQVLAAAETSAPSIEAIPEPTPVLEAPFDIRAISREPHVAAEAAARSYDARNGRAREVRARTISVKRMTKRDIKIGQLLYPPEKYWRPQTRGECAAIQRPCPFVSCKFNLYLDVAPFNGGIKLNFPDIEPDDMIESCVLDVAGRDGESIEAVGRVMNVTRERLRQIEERALIQLKASVKFEDDDGEGRTPVRAHQRQTA